MLSSWKLRLDLLLSNEKIFAPVQMLLQDPLRYGVRLWREYNLRAKPKQPGGGQPGAQPGAQPTPWDSVDDWGFAGYGADDWSAQPYDRAETAAAAAGDGAGGWGAPVDDDWIAALDLDVGWFADRDKAGAWAGNSQIREALSGKVVFDEMVAECCRYTHGGM